MANKLNEWSPDQRKLTKATSELQYLKDKFSEDSWEHKKIQSILNTIKSVIFNY